MSLVPFIKISSKFYLLSFFSNCIDQKIRIVILPVLQHLQSPLLHLQSVQQLLVPGKVNELLVQMSLTLTQIRIGVVKFQEFVDDNSKKNLSNYFDGYSWSYHSSGA